MSSNLRLGEFKFQNSSIAGRATVDVAKFDIGIDDSATIGVIATIRDLAKDGDFLTLRELSSLAISDQSRCPREAPSRYK